MSFAIARVVGVLTLVLLAEACTQADKREADARAAEAQEKAREGLEQAKRDARKLGAEAKTGFHQANERLNAALDAKSPPVQTSTADATRKLDRAGEIARQETAQAGRKLDQAALIARVKAKLAADVGLTTVSGIEVDAAGRVVTLQGNVSSDDQKREAERAAGEVDGVGQVVNELVVQ